MCQVYNVALMEQELGVRWQEHGGDNMKIISKEEGKTKMA